MTEEEIRNIVENEIKVKSLRVTEAYLEIHSPVYVNGQLKIARIDRDRTDGVIVIWLPVEKERFYFVIYIDPEKRQVYSFGTEPLIKIYFKAFSETHTENQLKDMTRLDIRRSWNKGDLKPNVKIRHADSALIIEVNPGPGEFSEKLRQLLDYLERDKVGVANLVREANGSIKVMMKFHFGNSMLGGMTIDAETISRMQKLNLEIDFDLYVSGNPIR